MSDWEPDVKSLIEDALAWDAEKPRMDSSFIDTTCPGCGKPVCALIVDGPDTKWVEVQCHLCGHMWTETT